MSYSNNKNKKSKLKKRVKYTLWGIFIIVMIISSVFHERRTYSVNRSVKHILEIADDSSHNRCALHVMRAMNAGGQTVPLLRACDYEWYFKRFLEEQFMEVQLDGYVPQPGDIVVFPKVKNHPYGHIAIWTGDQWVSDFKQKHFIVADEYKDSPYTIFRAIAVVD